jgi:hypothetical protein
MELWIHWNDGVVIMKFGNTKSYSCLNFSTCDRTDGIFEGPRIPHL